MNLLVLPDDGPQALLTAIRKAKQSVRVTLFRCDFAALEKALASAVVRGVAVHALIAHTNRAGEGLLRKLELRLLGAGVTISRTADDLVRYHDKLLLVDERTLFVLGFNFTRLDVTRKRSMAVVTRKRELVAEALRLFEADATRQPFIPRTRDFLVSPENARPRLKKLLESARRSLWIYDPGAVDRNLLGVLAERQAAGVDVRLIGRVGAWGSKALAVAKLTTPRLHLRAILRDEQELFVGSQGMRALELDRRRELGIVVRDRSSIRRFKQVFEEDWASTETGRAAAKAAEGGDEAEAKPPERTSKEAPRCSADADEAKRRRPRPEQRRPRAAARAARRHAAEEALSTPRRRGQTGR